MAKQNGSAIENSIIKQHNSGMFRNWESRGESRSFNYATREFEVWGIDNDRAIIKRVEEKDPDFDLEEALNDPLNDTQLTFAFENLDPEDLKFSDDVREGQKDL